jgi:hypothetical protein
MKPDQSLEYYEDKLQKNWEKAVYDKSVDKKTFSIIEVNRLFVKKELITNSGSRFFLIFGIEIKKYSAKRQFDSFKYRIPSF